MGGPWPRAPLEDRVRAGVRLQAGIHERSAGVWSALRDAATSDEEVAAWCTEMELTRRGVPASSFEMMVGRRIDGAELDLLWALFGPELYLKLVRERGWSRDHYERHVGDAGLKLLR